MVNKTVKNKYFLDDGTPLASVTTVLDIIDKPFLVPWAAKMARQGIDWAEIRDNRGRIGTLAHELIDCQLNNTPCDVSTFTDSQIETAQKCKENFDEWYAKQNGIKILKTELAMVSKIHNFGGTCDIYYQDRDGKKILADWKSSKNIYENHKIQQCAYKLLLEEQGKAVDEIRLIGINEEFGLKETIIDNRLIPYMTELFLSALKLYNVRAKLWEMQKKK